MVVGGPQVFNFGGVLAALKDHTLEEIANVLVRN